MQVDDCVAKYMWVRHMTAKAAELKRAGQPMPKTVAEVEQTMGKACSWHSPGDTLHACVLASSPGPRWEVHTLTSRAAEHSHTALCAGSWRDFRERTQDVQLQAPPGLQAP